MNKWGIFLLMMSLLVHQFYDTASWQLGKYAGSFLQIIFCSLGALDRPFRDGNAYRKSFEKGKGSKAFYAVVGFLAALPLFAVIFWLLLSADVVFREGSRKLFQGIDFWDVCQVIGMVALMFFAVYCLLSFLCERTIKEESKDNNAELLNLIADVREKLRLNKNYEMSDYIRNELNKLDITISDKKL